MRENTSATHVLLVGEFVPEEPGDCFEVEHLDDCPSEQVDAVLGDDRTYTSYTCMVGNLAEMDGLDAWFRHQDAPADGWDSRKPLAAGRHVIEAWSAYDPPHPGGGGEWDGGLRAVEVPF